MNFDIFGIFSRPQKIEASDSEKAVIGRFMRGEDGEQLQMVLRNIRFKAKAVDTTTASKVVKQAGKLLSALPGTSQSTATDAPGSGKFETLVVTNQRIFALNKKDEALRFQLRLGESHLYQKRVTQTKSNSVGANLGRDKVTITYSIFPQMMIFSPDLIFNVVKWHQAQKEANEFQTATQVENEGVIRTIIKGNVKMYKDMASSMLHPTKATKEASEKYTKAPSEWYEVTNFSVGQRGFISKKACLKITSVQQNVYDWIPRACSSPADVKASMGTPMDPARSSGKLGKVINALSVGRKPNFEIMLSTDDITEELYNALKRNT